MLCSPLRSVSWVSAGPRYRRRPWTPLPSRLVARLRSTLFRVRDIQSLWIARRHTLSAARGSGAMSAEKLWCGVAFMVAESSGARRTRVRECVCCGAATATPSLPACWDDWNLLPEDLRSSIIKNYGRRQINEYADDLLAAVAFWRQVGAWRSKLGRKVASAAAQTTPSAPTISTTSNERNVIALAERRRSSVTLTAPYSESEYPLGRPMTAAR